MHMQIWPGEPYPLGAAYDGTGTNFSLFTSEIRPSSRPLRSSSKKATDFDVIAEPRSPWIVSCPGVRLIC
jgi:isoamylase